MIEKTLKDEELNILDKVIGGLAGYAAGAYVLREMGYNTIHFSKKDNVLMKRTKPGMLILASVAGGKVGKYCAEEFHAFRVGLVSKYLK